MQSKQVCDDSMIQYSMFVWFEFNLLFCVQSFANSNSLHLKRSNLQARLRLESYVTNQIPEIDRIVIERYRQLGQGNRTLNDRVGPLHAIYSINHSSYSVVGQDRWDKAPAIGRGEWKQNSRSEITILSVINEFIRLFETRLLANAWLSPC